MRFDAANLAQDLSSNNNDGQIYKLLSDFENLINASKHDTLGVGQNIIQYTEQRINILRDHASALYKEILALMLTREKSSRNPKAKLTIRTKPPSSVSSEYEPVENAVIRVEGNCFDISGLSETSQPLSWPEFTAKAEADIVFQWRKALTSLISSSQSSKFLDDNSIVSFGPQETI